MTHFRSPLLPENDSISGGIITATEPRINDRIRASEIRLVGPDGEQIGVVALPDALELAREADLDLVEVAADARPPVCRLMDYGREKYQASQRARDARKKQMHVVVKEVRFRVKIAPHDYETKMNRAKRFLEAGDKVKVTVMFRRGRESARPQLGTRIMEQLKEDIRDVAVVEAAPVKDGWNMIMILAPHRKPS